MNRKWIQKRKVKNTYGIWNFCLASDYRGRDKTRRPIDPSAPRCSSPSIRPIWNETENISSDINNAIYFNCFENTTRVDALYL